MTDRFGACSSRQKPSTTWKSKVVPPFVRSNRKDHSAPGRENVWLGEFVDALGRVKIAIDTQCGRAEIDLPMFREHSKSDAKAIERLLDGFRKLEPEVTGS